MLIHVRGSKIELTQSLKRHVERAVHHALDRFESRIESVEVRLSDVNGPRKGEDMQCRIVVSLMRLSSVVVEHCDRDLYVAVDRAAGRTKRAVRRTINRPRDARQRQRVDMAGNSLQGIYPATA